MTEEGSIITKVTEGAQIINTETIDLLVATMIEGIQIVTTTDQVAITDTDEMIAKTIIEETIMSQTIATELQNKCIHQTITEEINRTRTTIQRLTEGHEREKGITMTEVTLKRC